MWFSLKLPSNEQPRWPEVPKATRCAGTDGSGFTAVYAASSLPMSTRMDFGAGLPASGLIC